MRNRIAFIEALRITLVFSLIIPLVDLASGYMGLTEVGFQDVRLGYFALLVFALIWSLRYPSIYNIIGSVNGIFITLVVILYNLAHPYLVNKIFFSEAFVRVKPILWTVFLGPLCEEIIFRGIIYSSISKCYENDHGMRSALSAMVISTLMFSLWHFNNYIFSGASLLRGGPDLIWTVLQALNAFFIGIMYAYLRYRTGNIFPSTAAHIAHNGGAYFISV